MATPDPSSTSTRDQLIVAAGRLFAEHGYDSTSTRAIADACSANLAAIHYHFGSKHALYLAVLETVCRDHIAAVQAGGEQTVPATPTAIAQAIREHVGRICASLIGPRSVAWHAQLMAREMAHPSSVHNLVIERLAAPMHARWVALHRQVRPQAAAVEAHVWDLHLPAMLRLLMTARPTMHLVLGTGVVDEAFLHEAVRQTADVMILLLGLPLPPSEEPTA